MSSLYGSEDRSEESSPEPQGPLDDQTNAPINADGPIVVDDFSVCVAEVSVFSWLYADSAKRMKIVNLATILI